MVVVVVGDASCRAYHAEPEPTAAAESSRAHRLLLLAPSCYRSWCRRCCERSRTRDRLAAGPNRAKGPGHLAAQRTRLRHASRTHRECLEAPPDSIRTDRVASLTSHRSDAEGTHGRSRAGSLTRDALRARPSGPALRRAPRAIPTRFHSGPRQPQKRGHLWADFRSIALRGYNLLAGVILREALYCEIYALWRVVVFRLLILQRCSLERFRMILVGFFSRFPRDPGVTQMW